MGQFAKTIVESGRRYREFADMLLAGISPAHFARKPIADGKTIDTNHPAWICGHLSLYPALALRFLKLDDAQAAVPDTYSALFAPGTECVDDADGTRYPLMSDLVERFRNSYDTALDLVEQVDDSALDLPVEESPYRDFMSNAGQAAMVLLGGHVSFHLGQISTWRRCMGLGPAKPPA